MMYQSSVIRRTDAHIRIDKNSFQNDLHHKRTAFEIWTKCLFGNYYNFRIVISVNRFNYHFYNNWYRTLETIETQFYSYEKVTVEWISIHMIIFSMFQNNELPIFEFILEIGGHSSSSTCSSVYEIPNTKYLLHCKLILSECKLKE